MCHIATTSGRNSSRWCAEHAAVVTFDGDGLASDGRQSLPSRQCARQLSMHVTLVLWVGGGGRPHALVAAQNAHVVAAGREACVDVEQGQLVAAVVMRWIPARDGEDADRHV